MSRVTLLSSCLVIAALCGCNKQDSGSAAPATPPPSGATSEKTPEAAPSGMTEFKTKGDTIAISVAPGWTPLDLTGDDYSAALDEAAKKFPNIGTMKGQLEPLAKSKMAKLFVLHDKVGKTNFYPNLNVLEMPMGGMTFDKVVDQNLTALKGSSKTDFSSNKVKLGSVDAVEVKWTNSAQGQEIPTITYLVPRGDKAYDVLTFSLAPGSNDQLQKEAEEMAQTFSAS